MAREGGPQHLVKLGPLAIGAHGEVIGHDPAAACHVVQETLAEQLLDGRLVRSLPAERLPPHVRLGRRDPRPAAIVHYHRVELLKVLGQIHGQVAAYHGLEGPGLLAQSLDGEAAVGHAVALVRILLIEVLRGVPDEHLAGLGGRNAGLLGRRLPDLLLPMLGDLLHGRPGRRRQDHCCKESWPQ